MSIQDQIQTSIIGLPQEPAEPSHSPEGNDDCHDLVQSAGKRLFIFVSSTFGDLFAERN